MKTINSNKKYGRLLILAFLLPLTLLSACGKKSGGGSRAINPYVYNPNCPNCGLGTSNLVASGHGTYNSYSGAVNMGLNLIAAQSTTTQPTYSTSMGYTGAVNVDGYASIQGIGSNDCPIPNGTYTLRTPQPNGTFNRMNTFDVTNLYFEAVSGSTVVRMVLEYGEFYDSQAVIGLDHRTYASGFYGQVVVQSVNNYPCGYGYPIAWFFPRY